MKKHIFALVAGSALLFLTTACNSEKAADTGSENSDAAGVFITAAQFSRAGMQTGPLTDTSFRNIIQVMGVTTVPPGGKTMVGSFYGGKVVEIAVQQGQRVIKGQVLMRLANPEYISVQQAFLENRATLGGLRQEYERQEALYTDQVASQKSYQQAKAAFETATASDAALREQLRLLNIRPDQLQPEGLSAVIELRAPFNGIISRMEATVGEWLGNEQNPVEMIDPQKLQIETQVFEKDLLTISEGMEVMASPVVNNALSFKGIIRYVSPLIETDGRSAAAIIRLDEAGREGLKPGMHMNVEVSTVLNNYTALPETAVVEADGRFYTLMLRQQDENGYYFDQVEVKPLANQHGYTALSVPQGISTNAVFLLKGAFQLIGAEE